MHHLQYQGSMMQMSMTLFFQQLLQMPRVLTNWVGNHLLLKSL
jgi:hypothetical protein